MSAPAKSKQWCHFCGKQPSEVQVLVVGPGVNICNECVALCVRLIKEQMPRRRGELLTEDPDHGDD